MRKVGILAQSDSVTARLGHFPSWKGILKVLSLSPYDARDGTLSRDEHKTFMPDRRIGKLHGYVTAKLLEIVELQLWRAPQ